MPTCQKMAFAKSPTFSFTFLKCIASCWPIFMFGLHFPGALIFVPCAKCFVFFTLRSRGAWGRPNVPKMHLVTFRFRRRDPIASAFGPKGWTFRRSEPPRGSHLAPQGPIRRLIDGWLHGDFVRSPVSIECDRRVYGTVVGEARMKCQS